MARKKTVGVVVSIVILTVLALPLGYQQLAKMSLEEQAPPLIESWLMKAFPDEYEPGAVKRVEVPRTFRQEVPVPATVMNKGGSMQQVCVTFERESLFGDWFAIGECVPANS